ncbi:hypothetical protein [Paenibacillus sp. FJAT-26967]|uniref:hypothetical protein n=1 Tax=Paenibacillus sp. FJAT-26967 TaxID=1729690 RepID=UPI000838A81C|nr:hypothetical protein [Paenibacillus sp. FJAT-26967]
MKRRTLGILFICLALFAILPITSASAVSNSQISGQGELVITASFQGSTADLWVTNQNSQVVYSRAFGSYGGTGTIYASIPNLPSGTYTISIGGPQLSISNLQYYFK